MDDQAQQPQDAVAPVEEATQPQEQQVEAPVEQPVEAQAPAQPEQPAAPVEPADQTPVDNPVSPEEDFLNAYNALCEEKGYELSFEVKPAFDGKVYDLSKVSIAFSVAKLK